MESQPLEEDGVDFDDGLSPRLSGQVQSTSLHPPQRFEPPFLSTSNEEVYEDSPRPVEITSATAEMVASIYGEFEVEMKASAITQSLEAMALKEGTEVIALCGAKLATFEELLDPDNVDPIVTRDECFVALQRWHRSCDSHVMRVNGKDVSLPPEDPKPDDDDVEDETAYINCTLSPCCRRVPNEEVDELHYQNKVLRNTIDELQFQLATIEKKQICLKDEKLKLTQEARELRTTMDMYYVYKGENDILERDNTRLGDVILALKEDLTKAKKERDDFKRQAEDLDITTNELTLKLEQCVQSETVSNHLTSRRVAQINVLQVKLDVALEKLSDKERDIVELKLLIQRQEEGFTELRKAKERKLSEECDDIENLSQLARFNTPDVYEGDSLEVPTLESSVQGGMSLFAELQTADVVASIFRPCRDASTSYELVSSDRATQTPEMEEGKLPVMGDRETQTFEIIDNMTYQNSTPDKEDHETQTVENLTPDKKDRETQTVENLTPDKKDGETQTVENSTSYIMKDHETQTYGSIERVDLASHNYSTSDMEDRETQTYESIQTDMEMYLVIPNPTPCVKEHEPQTGGSTESVDTYLMINNATPDMEDGETQTGVRDESVDPYQVTQNSTPYIMKDRATQTDDDDDIVAMYPTQNAMPGLQVMEDRDTWTTTNTYRSTFVMNVANETTVPDTGVSFKSYRAIVPVKRDCSDERGFRNLPSNELNAESHGNRLYSFADVQSFAINCEETSPATLTALNLANADVDGSGDASCSPFGVVSSNSFDEGARDTRYAASKRSPRSPRSYRQGVKKRANTNQLRRNDAQTALDREMALLGIEIEGVSRSAQRQFAVVGRALERALEEFENNGRAMQELRFAQLAEGNTRCAATMTVMFPLRRSVSEPPVGCSVAHRPVRRGRLMPYGVRRDDHRPPPPPISEPARPVVCVPPNDAETVGGVTTSCCHHTNYGRYLWRFVLCGFFMAMGVVLVHSYMCFECRTSRFHPTFSQIVFDLLERYGIVKRNRGPRPM